MPNVCINKYVSLRHQTIIRHLLMFPLLLSLLTLGVIAFIIGKCFRPSDSQPAPSEPDRPDGCCGRHEVCEKLSRLDAVGKQVEYYEDEELDTYRQRSSSSYTPQEEEAFREVLYTMRPDEVPGWLRSLELRGIELPDGLKDEVILLVNG